MIMLIFLKKDFILVGINNGAKNKWGFINRKGDELGGGIIYDWVDKFKNRYCFNGK